MLNVHHNHIEHVLTTNTNDLGTEFIAVKDMSHILTVNKYWSKVNNNLNALHKRQLLSLRRACLAQESIEPCCKHVFTQNTQCEHYALLEFIDGTQRDIMIMLVRTKQNMTSRCEQPM